MTARVRGAVWAVWGWALAAPAFPLDPATPIDLYTQAVWQTANGLPQNTVGAMAQTRDGYLWLGTQEGLVRFDGVRFSVFDATNTEAITNNHIVALVAARDGSLWIGTYGGGLVRLKDRRFESYVARASVSEDRVTALAEDAEGGLWVGTTAGLGRLRDGRWTRYDRRQGLPSDTITALYVGRDGTPWIGTAAGLCRFRDGAFAVVPARGLPGTAAANVLTEDRQGQLWIGTNQGLAVLDRGTLARFAAGGAAQRGLLRAAVRALHLDRAGSLWFATERGLGRLASGRVEAFASRDGLSSDSVMSLWEDREGSLWVGTDGGGLVQFQEGPFTTYTTRQGLSSDVVYAVGPSRAGGLWVGTYGGDVSGFRAGRFVPLGLKLDGSRVRTLYEDPERRLWIGTDRALYLHAGGRTTTYGRKDGLPTETVRVIAGDAAGRVWIGTDGGGLVRFEKGRFTAYGTRDGLAGGHVRAILEDHQGDLWVGTYEGLSRLRGGRFTSYFAANGLASNLVRCLYEDREGTLWIGTYGGGLSRLKDGALASCTRRQGLLSDAIYQILEDDQARLWMTCNQGIFRVSKKEFEDLATGRTRAIHSTSYGEADGMRSRECNGGSPAGWPTPDGALWFPTLKGVVRVDPARVGVSREPPPVVLEEIRAGGRWVDQAGDLRFPAGERQFEFRFAALSFVAPQRLHFRYQLEGFDRDWVEAGPRRVAYYTNVPPGSYRFRVIAGQENGPWNEEGAGVSFTVAPYFRETVGFRLLVALGFVVVLSAFFQLRTRRMRRYERLLEQRVEEAVTRIKVLSGLLPICASCKKIRDDQGYWSQVEVYIRERSEADFTHSICPECVRRLYPELADRVEGSEL